MSNKSLGTAFEQEFCNKLATLGYWVHFIVPDARGAQPFDVIAAKDGRSYAYDCKTCVSKSFSIRRLEDNQVMAFEKWMKCGNDEPLVAVKHDNKVFLIGYKELKEKKSIRLDERTPEWSFS